MARQRLSSSSTILCYKNIVFGMLALVVSVVAIGLAYAGFTGTLNVNTQDLSETAIEFGNMATDVFNLMNEMIRRMQELAQVWQGSAKDRYSEKFGNLKDDMERIIRMIKEHSDELQEMAKMYEDAETANEETIGELLDNIIE